jgi:cell division protein FtsI (penicillin-binding protein 3)
MFSVIGLRLVEMQVADAPAYAAKGLSGRLSHIELPAPRGSIYDRNMDVLADSVEARYVYADPTRVEQPEQEAAQLSPLLGIPVSALLPKLKKHNRPDGVASQFEYLARGVDISDGDSIEALNLAGIGVRRDEKRDVPGKDLAANLIGFTGEDLNGLEGMEARYDDLLRGVDGERVFEVGNGDLAKEIPNGYHQETPAQPGSSLELTIDRDLQYEAQRVLFELMPKVKADWASATVTDVQTGEVLAQASYPTYNAADAWPSKPSDRDDAASSVVVDPGSVHKAIVFGAALQSGVITPDSTIAVAPTITKGDTTYADTHPMPAGTKLSLPAILAYSSNVGTIKIADMLGAQRLYDYQRKFGLGTLTEEGLPGESAGLVQPPKNWSVSSYGSIPIGMGVSATPLQMASAYAAIANNGVWVQPHLVRATIDSNGKVTPAKAPTTRTVLSPENAAALRTMLEAVTSPDIEGATGHNAAIPGYRVAGKTGTGRQVKDGKYTPGEVASFIGMAPADSPRFVVSVFAHTPGGEGGAVAGPAFREIMQFVLAHYRVPPTGAKAPKFAVSP